MLRHRNRKVLATACALLAGCSSSGHALTTVVTTSPPTTTTVAAATTSAAPTTAVVTTVPSTTEVAGVELSAGGPWTRVDGAPGITTPGLFYELMPKLWVYLPTKEDIAHNIVWTFTERDRPIIEGYLQAQLVYYRSISSNPINLADPGWDKFYLHGSATSPDLIDRTAKGEYGDLDQGVVLRPQVIGDERTGTQAIVFDCLLDGGVFRMHDGSLAPGSNLGVGPTGVGFRMELQGSTWQATQIGRQREACQ